MSPNDDRTAFTESVYEAARHMLREEWEDAIDNYRVALRHELGSPFIHRYLALAMFKCGNYDEATTEYEKEIELDGMSADAHHGLGVVLTRRFEETKEASYLDKAIPELELALRIRANDPEKHNALGHALFAKGDLRGAYWNVMRATSIHPYNESYMKDLLVIIGRLDNMSDAIKSAQEATRLSPRSDGLWYLLGTLQEKSGDHDGARISFLEALIRYPRSAPVHEAMTRLRKTVE